jgi:SP family arabinose:H+ symporter-like MFS transporter
MVFGYDLGALSGATEGLMRSYRLSPAQFGLTISISLWGAMCASPIAGRVADWLGRRGLFALSACLYAIAAGALAFPVQWPWSFVLALRLVCGLAIGGFVVCCPLYLAEIAPAALRGRFVGLFQLQIGLGAIAAFVASAMVASRLSQTAEWKWCFGLGVIPPVCLLCLLRWVPEEPHWLFRRGRLRDAIASARQLGLRQGEFQWQSGDAPSLECAADESLFQSRYLRPLLLAACVALFNQLCGVTVLRVYLLDLLASAGMGRSLSHYFGVILACLNLAALVLGVTIVDKIGRRPLLILGSLGMALCLIALVSGLRSHANATFYLVTLGAYNMFFACSQGAAAWVYLSELFPFSVRGKGQGFGALIHWIANAGLIWLFPLMEHALPKSSFMLFAFVMVIQILVVLLWYPETKGIRLGAVAELSGAGA